MVAWLSRLGTWVFGNTQWGVRIVNDLVMLGASGVMYLYARQWWSRRAAFWAALSLQILPIYFGIGFIATMNGALIFWWLICLLGISLALRRNQAAWWYLAGLGFGGALQSKYSAIFLAPGALILLLAHRPYWKWLKSPHSWLGLALGVACFTPTILWNAQHDWASFRFQFLSRSNGDAMGVADVGNFILFQLAVLTPLVLAGAVVLLKRLGFSKRRWTGRQVMAFAFCLPLVAALAYKSLREAHIDWTVPAYLSLLPALAHAWDARMRLRRIKGDARGFDWRPGMAITAWVCVAINAGLILYLMLLQPHVGGVDAFGPWRPIAQAVEEREDLLEAQTGRDPLVIANGKYRLASVLAFYRLPMERDAKSTHNTTSQWLLGGEGLGYRYWLDRSQWIGRDCVYVTMSKNAVAEVSPYFRRVEALPPVQQPSGKPCYIVFCYGLLG
jgi:dolichol-phosphate mannosyltransferase